MKYYIYKHTNLANGKSYIGMTSMKPEKRWKKGIGYKAQPKFFNAILKYGWDGFEHEVIATCNSKEDACAIEQDFIEKYDCIRNGYNATKGGMDMYCATERIQVDKYNPVTGKLICTYPSIAEASDDTGASDSHISECCNGKHKTAAGYGWTYHGQSYEKPSKCTRFCKIEKVNPRTWEVIEVYNTQKEAAEAAGVSKSAINLCCKGKTQTAGGYSWRYA